MTREHPAWFHRFDAVWTPTVLLLDAAGKERARLEGYLPNNDSMAALKNGLGRSRRPASLQSGEGLKRIAVRKISVC